MLRPTTMDTNPVIIATIPVLVARFLIPNDLPAPSLEFRGEYADDPYHCYTTIAGNQWQSVVTFGGVNPDFDLKSRHLAWRV
jgi:hypothetical protein